MIFRKLIFIISFSFFLNNFLFAQNGIRLNTDDAMQGYVLVEYPEGFDEKQFLLNNCGDIVHSWDTGGVDLHAKLLEDGSIIYVQNSTVYRRDWNNNIMVSHATWDIQGLNLVYEVILLPNGNYLCAARRSASTEELEDIGWNFNIGQPSVTDGVVEIDAVTGEVVWEWNIRDHVIQERSSSINNYGSVADNPQLLDCDAVYSYDWTSYESFMINGMDYNPELDQIALSVRKVGEVMLIDHSTTTEEAKGSTGGNSGMGGDFIYRFGNPQNYKRGTEDDRYLFFQHNPNWILHGPHKGKMMCYNNGLGRPDVTSLDDRWSAAPIFDPQENGYNYILPQNDPYAPLVPEQTYDKFSTGTSFYSGYTSAAKILPNENILITEGKTGRIFELKPDGEKVWEYDLPGNQIYTFRSEKYPLDYPAFENKDLSSTGETIEFPSSTYNCDIVSTKEQNVTALEIVLNKTADRIHILHSNQKEFEYLFIDISGKKMKENVSSFGECTVSLHDLPTGVYALKIIEQESRKFKTYKIFID